MSMKAKLATAVVLLPLLVVLAMSMVGNQLHAALDKERAERGTFDAVISAHAEELFRRGAEIFRDDTFGDDKFWGDTLKLHQAIGGARFGGVGPGVSRSEEHTSELQS